MDTAEPTVAFLGVGTMGEALLKGSLDGGLPAGDVWVTARDHDRIGELTDAYGVRGTTDNAEAVGNARIIVLAVLPRQVQGLLTDIAGRLRDDAVVVCLADGVTIADVRRELPQGVAVVRAMPSLTARFGRGLTLVTFGESCTEQQSAEVEAFFARSGEVIRIEEGRHADLGPLSSGGPAYFFYVADAMIEAGALRGVPRDLGRRLVAQAMAGCAAWLQESDADAGVLRAKVCAPGGAGIRRIAELDERAVRAAFVAALTKGV